MLEDRLGTEDDVVGEGDADTGRDDDVVVVVVDVPDDGVVEDVAGDTAGDGLTVCD